MKIPSLTSKILATLQNTRGIELYQKARKVKKKLFFIASVILLITTPIIFYTAFVIQSDSEASWFDNNWLYRQGITVTNSTGGTLTNMQKLFTINTSTLISAGKLQSNCADLRFINQKSEVLPYYVASGCNTTTTKVWVLIPSLPTSTSTVYMYYGNPSATQGSNSSQFDNLVGLAGYWTLNDAAGSTATDSSVNENNGTATGTTIGSGKYGNDRSFNGTTDYVEVPYTAVHNPSSNFTLEAWAYVTGGAGTYRAVITSRDASSSRGYIIYAGSNDQWQFWTGRSPSAGWNQLDSNVAVTLNQWTHIVGTFDGSVMKIYINGVLANTSSGITFSPNSVKPFRIGADGTGGQYFPGQVDDVRIYNTMRTASQIVSDYRNTYTIQTAGLDVTYSFGSEQQAPGPIAYWALDEGTGTTTHDSTANKKNGTLYCSGTGCTTPQWKSGSECVSGKCLQFISDGSSVGGYVEMANTSTATITGNQITLSVWIKPNTIKASGQDVILWKNDEDYDLRFTNGNLRFNLLGIGAITYSGLTTNTWYHIVAVYNGSTQKIYVNGVEVASANATGSLTSDGGIVRIGRDDGADRYFNGLIDEVKIYPYARSANQIASDYLGGTQGSSTVLGSASEVNLSNGLVGYWKMDESSWNGTSGEVKDTSGNANHGAVGGTPIASISNGKFGNAGLVDGSGNYISISDSSSISPTAQVTVAGWVWVNSYSGSYARIISKSLSYDLHMYTYAGGEGRLEWDLRLPSETDTQTPTTAKLSLNRWHHVAATYDGSSTGIYIDGVKVASRTGLSGSISDNTNPLRFGGTGSFDGKVDDFRVYNRALSPSEVSQLYNFAPKPVAYWDFEDSSGNSVIDKSGNGLTGTWSGTGTHWTTGKYGKGAILNGSDDQISMGDPASGLLEPGLGNFSYCFWIKTTATSGQPVGKGTWGYSAWGTYMKSEGKLTFEMKMTNPPGSNFTATTAVINDDQWHHVCASIDRSSTMSVYTDGVYTSSVSITAASAQDFSNSASFVIGNGNPGRFNGSIDEVKYYNYARTPKQIIEDMNAGHPVGGSPIGSQIGYWKFDEGYGTTAHDVSPQKIDGTLSGTTKPSWSNSGKFGKALSFDGSSSYVALGNISAYKTDNKTISFWAKPSTAFGTTTPVLSSSGANWYAGFSSTGMMMTSHSVSAGSQQVTYSNANAYTANEWHYYAYTFNVAGSNVDISFYVDGKLNKTVSYTTGYSASYGSSFILGAFSSSSFYYSGLLDEVKIYNSALTAEEIKIDYNRNAATVMGALGTDASGNPSNSADRAYCPPGDTTASCGPVGEWNFEEGSGSNVNDTSGNGNTGSWNGTGSHWTQGKVGKAGNFNLSTIDYVSIPDAAILRPNLSSYTVDLWFKKTSACNTKVCMLIDKRESYPGNSYAIYLNLNTIYVQLNDGTSHSYPFGTATSYDWTHLTVVINRTTNTLEAYVNGVLRSTKDISSIGTLNGTGTINVGKIYSGNGELFDGKIDQVHIYNYARTPAQIAWDYNRGKPIAHWKIDECQGTTIHDSSGNGNTGTLAVGASGSQTAVGTCATSSTAWGNGASGKRNYSLNFDGTDDEVQTSTSNTPATSGTLSSWIYPDTTMTSPTGYPNIVRYGSDPGIYIQQSTGKPYIQVHMGTPQSCVSSQALTANSWQHIVGTYEASGSNTLLKVYINGKEVCSSTKSGTIAQTAGAFFINSSSIYKGQIDDTQIYNYALTPQQIKTLYTNGAVNYGPSNGTP